MQSTIKGKWVEKLESGNVRQCDGQLRSQDREKGYSYCCLGVLCSVVDPKGWDGETYEYKGGAADMILPDNLREELGISDDDQGTLTDMNDNGKSFREIATWIRENL